MKNLLIATLIATAAISVNAAEQAQQVIELQDGAKLHIYKNGKMAMEDKFGRAVGMKEGEVMVTKDGKRIVMRGNEVFYLDAQLHKDHKG